MNFSKMNDAFIGGDLTQINVENKEVKRIYFDSAASNLALKPAQDLTQDFLKYYSNTHSTVHLTAQISNDIILWAQERIKKFVGADNTYTTAFIGNGTTAVMNRLAAGLRKLRPEKKKVLITMMEHHSNDLPHRQQNNEIIHLSLRNEAGDYIGVQLQEIEKILQQHQGEINYISITGASNVTGDITPIYDIAALAHQYDAYIIVDGAQLVAHSPVEIKQLDENRSIDFFVFSGHKVYTPGSPGVLIAKNEILKQMEPEYYGGGMVAEVNTHDFSLASSLFDRENAGTLNIPGIISLATTLEFLDRIGMENILEKEIRLTQYFLTQIQEVPNIQVYNSLNDENRQIGVVSFNMKQVPHQLLASILNDFFGIAVRNDCFCAHPYVRECIVEDLWDIEDEAHVDLFQGMVRASFGLYSTKEEIDFLLKALLKISSNLEFYQSQYVLDEHKKYHHIFYQNENKFDIAHKLEYHLEPFLVKDLNLVK